MNKTQLRKIVERLVVIEGITLHYDNICCPLDKEKELKFKDDIVGDIYRLVHTALDCRKCCKHPNVRKQDGIILRRAKYYLKKWNVVDVSTKVQEYMDQLNA